MNNQIFFHKKNTLLTGFTLLESLVMLSITAILTSLALPNFGHMIRNHQSDSDLFLLRKVIYTARSLAITSKKIVSLCPYQDKKCGDQWEDGIMIFTDKNNNGEIDDKDRLLEKIDLSLKNSTLTWRGSGGRNYLRFSSNGIARQFGRFHLCDKKGDMSLARTLVINRQGRVRQYRDLDRDGIVEDHTGMLPDCE